MFHTFTTAKQNRYRYYVCVRAQKEGWDVCPNKSISAQTIEKFVVDKIREIGRDSGLLSQTYSEANRQIKSKSQSMKKDLTIMKNNLKSLNNEMKELIGNLSSDTGIDSPVKSRMADLQELISAEGIHFEKKSKEIDLLKNMHINKAELNKAFSAFEPLWDSLSIKEQARIIRLLIEHIGYDGKNNKIALSFRPAGIKSLAMEYKEI